MYNSILEKRGRDGRGNRRSAKRRTAARLIRFRSRCSRLRPRTARLTPTPGASQTEQAETVQPVFATGAGAFLGIDRPSVGQGQAVYPVLTSRPTVHGPVAVQPTRGTRRGVRRGAVAAEADSGWIYLPPDGCHAVLWHGFGVRMALNSGLQEKLDLDAIAGTDGLLTGSNLGNHNVSAVTTFALYLSQFLFSRVDGRYAEQKNDIRVLMGSGTYGHAGGVYQSSAYKSALSALEQDSGGVRVSAHVPAVASNRQNAVVRRGMRRDMVQPVWGAVTIIVDEVTLSGKGESKSLRHANEHENPPVGGILQAAKSASIGGSDGA